MARGGGGRGRKVVMNSGKWQTVTKSSSPTKASDDSDDEGIATKMTNEDWSRLFEWFAEAQVICVKRGELPLFSFCLLLCCLIILSRFSFINFNSYNNK